MIDDPNIISYNSMTLGPFLTNDGAGVISGDELELTQTTLTGVENILFSRKSVETGVNGNGLLLTLKFNKLSSGKVYLSLDNVELSNSIPEYITTYDVYSLYLWDDSDSNPVYINDNVDFYASFVDKDNVGIDTNCEIIIDSNTDTMTYVNEIYSYTKTFSSPGEYTWQVTCDNTYTSSDKVTIGAQQCIDNDGDGYGNPASGTCDHSELDCDDSNGNKYPSNIEICGDGIDQDCSGEDLVCTPICTDSDSDGFSVEGGDCGIIDCDDTNGNINPDATEICDEIDNNCVDGIDEGVKNICVNYGTCQEYETCNSCSSEPQEVCDANRVDENCNGVSNEGCECDDGDYEFCGLDDSTLDQIGICLIGVKQCNEGVFTDCIGAVSPSEEICGDGLDNNCNAETDETCECENDLTEECGLTDVGECQFGEKTCINNSWGDCVGKILPIEEICDNLDNDCDDLIDEEVKNLCYDYETCKTYETCDECLTEPEEVCDGVDNNCNGDIDEGCNCINGNVTQCGSTEVGKCQFGEKTCVDGIWDECVGLVIPSIELCDGKDNDCDGKVDEDVCSSSSSSSSSGGGSRRCTEMWVCESYSTECVDGIKQRECRDLRNCGTTNNMPELEKECVDFCIDGIQNNGEDGVDCGGSCDSCKNEEKPKLPEEPKKIENVNAIVTDESAKESKVIVYYNNTENKRKTGVQFTIEITDMLGNVIVEDYFGPLIIKENEIFEEKYNIPLYLLNENQDYFLSLKVMEKGKEINKITNKVILDAIPTNIFFSRVNKIFFGIIILVLVVIVIFSRLFARGEEK